MRASFPVMAAAGLSLLGTGAAQAEDSPLAVSAIPGLFGMEATACGRPAGADPAFDSAGIDRRACAPLSPQAVVTLGQTFHAAVRARFPNVIDDPRTLLAEGQGRDLALNRTVLASLHVSRVKVWTYAKPGGVTASRTVLGLRMLMTNAVTGEVLYVQELARDYEGDFVARSADERITAQLAQALPQAVEDLVAEAAAGFNPYDVTARIVGQAGEDYVIDAGLARGVRDGDLFDGDVAVVFADANYAVIRPLLEDVNVGQTLTRRVAQPISALARPSMLAIVAHTPSDLLRSELLTLVETRLTEAGFATAPINPNFVEIRDQALGGAGVRFRQRPLPDYFLRVSADALDPTEGPNVRNLRPEQVQRLQEAWAFIEVIDRSGRVVFATTGRGRVEDQVFADLTFPAGQRQEAAITNALQVAVQNLAEAFRPAPLRLAARADGDLIRIADAGGALTEGVSARLLRRVGRVRGVEGDVWRPVGEVQVVSSDASGALARSAEVETIRPASGDVVAYHTTAASETRRRFAPCTLPSGQIEVDWMTAERQPLYPLFAVNGFAGGFRGPVFIPGFDALVARDLGQQFENVDRLGAARPVVADVCFQAVHSVSLAEARQTNSGARPDLDRRWGRYDLIMGYRLMQDGQRVGGTGVQETFTGQEIAVASGPDQDARVLQMDLATRAAELSRRAAAGLAPPP